MPFTALTQPGMSQNSLHLSLFFKDGCLKLTCEQQAFHKYSLNKRMEEGMCVG